MSIGFLGIFLMSLCSLGVMHGQQLPSRLQGLPYAEEMGIVLSSKKVSVNGVANPYNASIIENRDGSGYYIFFRYDVRKIDPIKNSSKIKKTFIGMAELDENFIHKEPSFKKIDTGSLMAEDPRAFYHLDKMYLSYNDLISSKSKSRTIRLAEFDPVSVRLKYTTNLDLRKQSIEKNWMPFSYRDKINFVYYVTPHKIIRLEDPRLAKLSEREISRTPQVISKIWESRWETIHGGTPAKLVDGEYLAFFHSRFKEDDMFWYSMGAYTFEAEPPFRITGISWHPILFHDLYDTEHVHPSCDRLRCIFPAGFVVKDDVIHVSAGENDAAIKILTLSKTKLLKSLFRIPVAKKDSARR